MPLVHPQFDPIAFSIGPLAVRWYGLMYLLAFIGFLVLGRLRAKETWRGVTRQDVDDLLFFGVLGVILGGRLGYVLFYKPGYYLSNPLEIFMIWKGGMASHGGIIGEICRQATASRPFAFVHADNGSVSRLVVHASGRWMLRTFNETSHLTVRTGPSG